MATTAPITLIGTANSSQWNRQAIGRFLSAAFLHNSGIGVRGGVIPSRDDPLKVVHTGARNLTINAGTALLKTTDSLGPLPCIIPSNVALTCDTADGLNPRYDLVVLEIDDLGTTSTVGQLRIVKGIPASSPQVPSTNWDDPASPVAKNMHNGGWMPLGAALIPASGSAGVVTTVLDRREFTVAAGGVLPLPGAFATPSLGSELPVGTPVWDETAKKLLVRSASGFERSDVPPVSHRRWSRSADVPTMPASYDMGNIEAALSSSAGPADVTLHSNKSDVVVANTGLYQLDAELYMDTSHASASASIKINNVPTLTSGFDNQGRANFGRVAYLTAGQTLNLQIQHSAGFDRTFSYAFAVTRIGL